MKNTKYIITQKENISDLELKFLVFVKRSGKVKGSVNPGLYDFYFYFLTILLEYDYPKSINLIEKLSLINILERLRSICTIPCGLSILSACKIFTKINNFKGKDKFFFFRKISRLSKFIVKSIRRLSLYLNF